MVEAVSPPPHRCGIQRFTAICMQSKKLQFFYKEAKVGVSLIYGKHSLD